MRFLIEFEGVLVDLAPVWYAAHVAVAGEVGWSALDQGMFWRLIRSQGRSAEVLRAAKPAKLSDYQVRFEQRIEADEALVACALHPEVAGALDRLSRLGECHMVTLGSNLAARREVLERRGLQGRFQRSEKLDPDPRRRPAELRVLAQGDSRTMLVAGTDALIRAGGGAELFTVGLSRGSCTAARLHQAGASVVYQDLAELEASLQTGGADLIRAGLLPPSLG